MPIFWKKISVNANVKASAKIRLNLPILKEVILDIPTNLVGVRLQGPKEQLFPETQFEGEPYIYGGTKSISWTEGRRISDGPPYDATIEVTNGEGTTQVVQVGLVVDDEQVSPITILRQILDLLSERLKSGTS